MTAPAPSIPQAEIIAPESGGLSHVLPAEIDQSCRGPVLFLLAAAAVWLGLGSFLSVLSAIKAHAPGFLPGPAWLTYGRVRPAASNAFVYGFLIQVGLAMALWMICRLGRSCLQGPRIMVAASGFWNVGLLIGIIGILAGATTGYEWLELPRQASPILFCSFVLLGVWALITFHLRRERGLYVSQWFLLAALLWFPWIYSTAQLFLVFRPTRGVLQAVIAGWYAHNLFELCLAPLALAVIFYLLPKLLGRPLHSRGLALFGFWLFVLFGGWGGVRPEIPAPNWLSGVTVVGRVFFLIPVLAVAMSWWGTLQNAPRQAMKNDWILRFVMISAGSYLLVVFLDTLGSLPGVNRITAFTLYDPGVVQLKLHCFLGMALCGAVYHVAPRLVGANWPSARLTQIHFWCVLIGAGLSSLALVFGGFLQGIRLDNSQSDFMSVLRGMLPFLGMSTLGATLLFVGYIAFIIHLGKLLSINCDCCAAWHRFRSVLAVPGKGKP